MYELYCQFKNGPKKWAQTGKSLLNCLPEVPQLEGGVAEGEGDDEVLLEVRHPQHRDGGLLEEIV